ncbi:iron complex transport system substrate-binding protein [Paenibacillus sp. UNCCL117]|uniref:ABC transporter substrate-binding protein n=1 Tax=unclassified Paenibacillus TaxID=185978 RepID=UPI00088EE16A|nr:MULTISPECIES: ABC transporter substrate-binding protein [unclassified Paenibacillus]SDD69962.1 iron complex transport system substrate-binding protein [Paenibacillus sp. cl123]SFW45241.1 iron complex transport system substrate-binding protein [Paenibacillus sp. UNCCL117]
MMRRTGWIIGLVVLLVTLAGCSSAPAPAPAAADQGSGTPKNSAESQAWPRTIKDAVGHEIVLNKKPERIAVLHPVYLDYFFALDEPPFAAANLTEAMTSYATLQPYAGKAAIQDLGSGRELSLEKIAESSPDVIITFKGHIDAVYDKLVKVAPVIQIDFSDSWDHTTMLCATIIGKEKQAEAYIQETREMIKKTRDKLGDRTKMTFAMLRIDGKANYFAPGTKNTMYYKADGFGLPAPQGYPADSQTMSLEALAQMNPDYIIFQHDIAMAKASVKEKESLNVWKSLNAVKSGHVLFFDNSLNTASVLAVRLAAEKLMELET